MWYLISQLGLFLVLAFVLGLIVGWMTSAPRQATDGRITDIIRGEGGSSFLLILLAAAIIGGLIAIFHFFRGVPGFWWDAIMLLLAAYFLGCVLGCLFRRWFGGGEAEKAAPVTAAATAAAGTATSARVATPEPAAAKPQALVSPTPVPAPAVAPAPVTAPKPEAKVPPHPFPTAPLVWSSPTGNAISAPAPAVAPAPTPTPAPVAAPVTAFAAATAATPSADVAAPYVWSVAHDGSTVTLTGHVPSDAVRSAIVERAKGAMPAAAIVDRMTIATGAAPVFGALAGKGIDSLGKLETGTAAIVDAALSVEGVAKDAPTRGGVIVGLANLPSGGRLAREAVSIAAPTASGPDDGPIVPFPAAAAVATTMPMAAAADSASADAAAPAGPAYAFDDASIGHGVRPPGIEGPRNGNPDNLRRVDGIARGYERKLHDLGIWHFDQIGAWTPENVTWMNGHIGFGNRIQREDWVGQCRVLASGGETEHSKKVDRGLINAEDDDAGYRAQRLAGAGAEGAQPGAVQFNDDDPSIIAAKPEGLAAPDGGKADDLKRIKGIGKVNEGRLNGLGIFHFHQIAAWGAEQAKWVNTHLSFPGRIQREDWIGQAKILATGGVTAFASRVDTGDVKYGAEGANYGSTEVDRGPKTS